MFTTAISLCIMNGSMCVCLCAVVGVRCVRVYKCACSSPYSKWELQLLGLGLGLRRLQKS